MRRAGWYGLSGLVVAGLLAAAGWGFQQKLQQRQALQQRLAILPAFAARDLAGAPVADLRQTAEPLVLVYFDPDCDHCQRQATELSRHGAEFGSTPIIWLSRDSLPTLRRFATTYGLSQYPGMRLLQIKPAAARTLDFFITPEIRIYDAQKVLIGRYRGEASAAAIVRKLSPK